LKLIQGAKLNLLIKGPNWYISKHQGPNYNLSFSSKMTPFWSHCSPPLPFRTDQTDSTGNKSGNSRPRHHDFLPMIPLMDWWTEERVFSACSGSIKGRAEQRQRGRQRGTRAGKKARKPEKLYTVRKGDKKNPPRKPKKKHRKGK